MFDITARKQAEDKILQLQRELEVLSYRDSLTGVANRRRFDTLYPVEWAKARATGGEEFVLLPATDEEAARSVAERCRKLLARHADTVYRHGLAIRRPT
ncbi:hypothetical protein GCM10008020_35800 [Massilia psychrophila]|nr:hypothetical protein GCM10008020_35800 [Massilia psychrophila]